MVFKSIQKLEVWRTLSTGQQVCVGTLAQNKQGVFFQYAEHYLAHYPNLSPFKLEFDHSLQAAPKIPHEGLYGVFSDALPDGWGRLLQDRVFRQHNILIQQITAMDRLAFVGHSALGALSFRPTLDYIQTTENNIDLATLGLEAQAVFDGQTDDVLGALVAVGSSGGARPKAQLYFNPIQPTQCRTHPQQDDEAWIIKFTSNKLALGHEESLCEAVYLTMAAHADLQATKWQLLNAPKSSGATHWLALKRFDWVQNLETHGRKHLHSICGLLDADFRSPSLDYEDLIKASRILCQSPAVGRLQFARAIFNLFACNQDDHSKNWAFLQDDLGIWQPTPFYDVTFSPHPYAEHTTSYAGYGKNPSLKAIQKLANVASFSDWSEARIEIQKVTDSIAQFSKIAASFNIHRDTIRLIQQQLNGTWQSNKHLYL